MLTGFRKGYVFPEIAGCGERHDALCDDELLDAGGESSVQYAPGPSNCRLEKALDQLAGQK